MRKHLLLMLLPWALGCPKDPVSKDDTGNIGDWDEDGFNANEDCNDKDPLVHPQADEICNAKDDNCDEMIDNLAIDASFWYPDADGDGFGSAALAVVSCLAPEGSLAQGGDCDDQDSAIHPDARESCDGVDEDCDGITDNNPTDGSTYYADTDNDSFGDLSNELVACELPDGYVTDASDCDDRDADIFPGGIERAGDGDDNDCDGIIDEATRWSGELSIIGASVRINGEDDYAYSGVKTSGEVDINLDGFDDLVIGSQGDDDAGDDAGAVYLFLGPVTSLSSLADADAKVIGNYSYDNLFMNALSPDLTGDGWPDLIVGAPNMGDDSYRYGGLAILPGPLYGTHAITEGILLLGDFTTYTAGSSLTPAGDVNADGQEDLLAGAPYTDSTYRDSPGAGFLFYGPMSTSSSFASASSTLYGPSTWSYAGSQESIAALGDISGDGYDDVAMGAMAWSSWLGAVFVVLGPSYGSYYLDYASYIVGGESKYGELGYTVEGPGDTNGDGYDDLLVSAPWARSNGAAYLFSRPPWEWGSTASGADLIIEGSSSDYGIGYYLSRAGDLDRDGYSDLMVGASSVYDKKGTCTSATGLVYGARSGLIDLRESDALFMGMSADCGSLIPSALGDHDGDGMGDLIFGAPQQSTGGPQSGTTFLFFGADIP